MENQAPYFLSVPNSNPVSLFSHYELRSVREEMPRGAAKSYVAVIETAEQAAADADAISEIFYTLYGRFDPAKHPERFAGVQAIANLVELRVAHELLIAINGPIPEDQE
jgi:hypothetical protein